jgi:centromere/kinetochore protein ZW10
VDDELRQSVCVDKKARQCIIEDGRVARACAHLNIIGADETRQRVAAFASTLTNELLLPMIRSGSVRTHASGDALRYEEIKGASDDFSSQQSLEEALRWIRSKLPSDDVARAIGYNVWGVIAKACVSAWLVNHPSETVVDRTCAVEAVALSCGFVPPPSDGSTAYAGDALGPLEVEARATEMQQAEARRAVVLARARVLALDDNHTLLRTRPCEDPSAKRGVGIGTGDETGFCERTSSPLDGSPCTVSKAVNQLAAHADAVLRSATELGPNAHRAAANLAAAASDCLDLFRACVTSARSEQLQSIHTASIVFYNDCHYLANRYSASVFAHSLKLERCIGKSPALMWPVEPLRTLGDATRAAANNRALGELHAALDVAGGFLRSGEVQVKGTIGKAVARARHVIHRACTASMYALPDPIGTKDAVDLVLQYARRVTLEILSLEDISVEESEALTEIISVAFSTVGLVGAKDDPVAAETLVREVGVEWRKACELGIMLSAPLRDITASWERGSLRDLGFTSNEIRSFIGALFSETSLRAECLARIQ